MGYFLIAVALFFVAFLALKIYLITRAIKNSRVAVCAVGENETVLANAECDAAVYSNHFSEVERFSFQQIGELVDLIEKDQFNVVHLLNEFTNDGELVDGAGGSADIAPIFGACKKSRNLLYLFLANSIGKNRNSTLTSLMESVHEFDKRKFQVAFIVDRGDKFIEFLDKLVSAIAEGKFLANAWLQLRPQDSGAPQPAHDPGPRGVVLLG